MNAMMREKSEAAVTGNETIERSIASLREKMDRDHALLAANQTTLSERIHQFHSALSERVHTVHIVLRDKTDELGKGLCARMDAKFDAINARIDALSAKLDKATIDIADIRSMLKALVWLVSCATSAAAVVNIGKAFNWF